MSPANLKAERILAVFHSVAEAKIEQHQLPPPELPEQVDYYKEILRQTLNLIQSRSTPTAGSSFGSSQQSESRSVSTAPAYAMTAATPTASQAQTPQLPSSLMFRVPYSGSSPYTIETRGVAAESPLLARYQGQSRSSNDNSSMGPLPQSSSSDERIVSNQPEFDATGFHPGLTSQMETGQSVMMPPPRRTMDNIRMVDYTARHSYYSPDSIPSAFTPDFRETFTVEDNQRSGNWGSWTSEAVPGGGEDGGCQICSNSGLVNSRGGFQRCFACTTNL